MNIQQCTVGEIVARDARAAEVFEQYHIDFCCNGKKTLQEACVGTADATAIALALDAALNTPAISGGSALDYRDWPIDLLADFIEKKYHREATRQIDLIKTQLDKICAVHGAAHPELFDIKQLFEESAGELAMHMKREELVLFPFVRKMVQHGKPPAAAFGTVGNPIRALTHEHEAEGERFHRIAELSNQYRVPSDGCNTYRWAFFMLKEFEVMLHFHIHLENNLLFPKALEMAEKSEV